MWLYRDCTEQSRQLQLGSQEDQGEEDVCGFGGGTVGGFMFGGEVLFEIPGEGVCEAT